MSEFKNLVKVLEGNKSLLIILPKEIGKQLDISDQDSLTYKINDNELVLRKAKSEDF